MTLNQLYLLLAVSILEDRSRGVNVASLLIKYTSRPPSLKSSVYGSLYRLCEKGLLQGWTGGKFKGPYYSVTRRGMLAVKRVFTEIGTLSSLSPIVLATMKESLHGKAGDHQGSNQRSHPSSADRSAARGEAA